MENITYSSTTMKPLTIGDKEALYIDTNSIYDDIINELLIKNTDNELRIIKNINNDLEKRELLWQYLINNYKDNTTQIVNLNKIRELNEKRVIEQNNKLKELKKILNSLKTNNNTKKRTTENILNEYNKLLHINEYLQVVTIVLLGLLVIPVLKYAEILQTSLAIVLYLIVLMFLVIYGIYKLMYKSINRHINYYKKINFTPPKVVRVDNEEKIDILQGQEDIKDINVCGVSELNIEDYDKDSLIISDEMLKKWKNNMCNKNE